MVVTEGRTSKQWSHRVWVQVVAGVINDNLKERGNIMFADLSSWKSMIGVWTVAVAIAN